MADSLLFLLIIDRFRLLVNSGIFFRMEKGKNVIASLC